MFDKILKLVGFLLFIMACFLIKKEVDFIGIDPLKKALFSVSNSALIEGVCMLFINYFILSFYDVLGLFYIRKRICYRDVFFMSSSSFAISNLTGHTYLSGYVTRYIFLKPFGVHKKEVLYLVYFISIAVLLGLVASFILAMFLEISTGVLTSYKHLPLLYLFTFLLIIGVQFYFKEIVDKKRSLPFGKIIFKAPTKEISFYQVLVGLLDFMTFFGVFYIFLSHFISCSFIPVFVVFSVSMAIAYLSQVPAGLGILESSFLILYQHTPSDKAYILSAFILFRLLYYVLPFLLFTPLIFVFRKKK